MVMITPRPTTYTTKLRALTKGGRVMLIEIEAAMDIDEQAVLYDAQESLKVPVEKDRDWCTGGIFLYGNLYAVIGGVFLMMLLMIGPDILKAADIINLQSKLPKGLDYWEARIGLAYVCVAEISIALIAIFKKLIPL